MKHPNSNFLKLWTIGNVLCFLMAFLFIAGSKRPAQPIPEPCSCLNYYQWQYYSTKRDAILDRLETGRLHKRQELTDSLNKYNKLLGL